MAHIARRPSDSSRSIVAIRQVPSGPVPGRGGNLSSGIWSPVGCESWGSSPGGGRHEARGNQSGWSSRWPLVHLTVSRLYPSQRIVSDIISVSLSYASASLRPVWVAGFAQSRWQAESISAQLDP
jgi:hypothetical protein